MSSSIFFCCVILFTIFRLGCQPCIYSLSPPAVVYSFLLLCDLVRSFSRCYCRIFVFVVVVAGYSVFFSLLCLVKVVISLLRITVSFHPLNSVRHIEYFCASPLSFFFLLLLFLSHSAPPHPLSGLDAICLQSFPSLFFFFFYTIPLHPTKHISLTFSHHTPCISPHYALNPHTFIISLTLTLTQHIFSHMATAYPLALSSLFTLIPFLLLTLSPHISRRALSPHVQLSFPVRPHSPLNTSHDFIIH